MASSTVEKFAPDESIISVPAGIEDQHGFRRQIGHISRHSSIYFIGTLFGLALGYPFKIYLARVLGPDALGIYALGMTIIGFLGIFNSLGIPQSAVRFVSAYLANNNSELLRGFLLRGTLLLVFANLIFGVVIWRTGPWIAVHFYHAPLLGPYFGWFAIIMLFGVMNGFFAQVLCGYKDVARRTFITNFVGNPLTMILTVVFVSAGLGLRGYIVAQVLSAFAVGFLLIVAVWRLTPQAARSFSLQVPILEKQVISFSAVALGMSFVEFLMAQADKILIGFYLDTRALGIYAVTAALIAFVSIILDSVNQIFSPSIAHLHARGEIELLGRIYQTLTKWVLGLTMPLAAVMIIFASPLMRIFGHDFELGWSILVIGIAGQLVNCAVGSVGYLLLMSGNQARLIKIQSIMAIVTVILALLLIPRWGLVGAAVASAAANAGANLWCLLEVRRRLNVFPYNRTYLRFTLPLLATLAILLLLREKLGAVHPEWIVIASALVLGQVTFMTAAVMFGLDTDDKLVISAIWYRMQQVFHFAGANA
ncbi:MAG TPA: flippase [Terriglobales bacterium]|nr:flippase [Terriglobales bacterium]